jgi:thiol-disulfide isomerase/thioredoxin
LTAIVLLLGLAALAWGRMPSGSVAGPLPPAPAIGHPAPDFTLASPDGQALTLSDLRGKPVVLNFWATWCGPCRAEMPELQRVHERLEPAGVTVLGINQAEAPEAIARYQKELGVDFPTILDSRLGVSRQYLVNSLPTTFFIDREGVIRSMFIGPMTDAVLAQNLRTIYP